MSILKMLTDDKSMYSSMYQVMYVKKNFPTLVSSELSESVYIFRQGRSLLKKLALLKNEQLRQASNRQTIKGSKWKQSSTNWRFLLVTPAVSGMKEN